MNTPQKKIRWNETIVPGIALLFVIAYFVQTRDAPAIAIYWPVITAVGGGILWGAILLRYVLLKRDTSPRNLPVERIFIQEMGRPGIVLVSSIVYLIAVPRLGFSVSNFVFMLLLFRGLGSLQWAKNFQVAIGITVFLHLALIMFMKLTLPQLNLGYFSI
jgi:hypothetical protein